METSSWLLSALIVLFLFCMAVKTSGEDDEWKKKYTKGNSLETEMEAEDVKDRKKKSMWDDDSIWEDDIHTDPAFRNVPGNIYHSD